MTRSHKLALKILTPLKRSLYERAPEGGGTKHENDERRSVVCSMHEGVGGGGVVGIRADRGNVCTESLGRAVTTAIATHGACIRRNVPLQRNLMLGRNRSFLSKAIVFRLAASCGDVFGTCR